MNERIKELALQAGYKDLPTVRLAFQGFDKEKFAQLIIQESIEVMMTHDYHAEWLGEKLKQHFGVEK